MLSTGQSGAVLLSNAQRHVKKFCSPRSADKHQAQINFDASTKDSFVMTGQQQIISDDESEENGSDSQTPCHQVRNQLSPENLLIILSALLEIDVFKWFAFICLSIYVLLSLRTKLLYMQVVQSLVAPNKGPTVASIWGYLVLKQKGPKIHSNTGNNNSLELLITFMCSQTSNLWNKEQVPSYQTLMEILFIESNLNSLKLYHNILGRKIELERNSYYFL